MVHFQRMDRDRQTFTLNYEISTMRGTKPTTTPQETTGLLVGPEQGRRPKTLQAIWLWWWRIHFAHSDKLKVNFKPLNA